MNEWSTVIKYICFVNANRIMVKRRADTKKKINTEKNMKKRKAQKVSKKCNRNIAILIKKNILETFWKKQHIFANQVESMATKSSIRKDRKPLDSIIRPTKMTTTRRRNSTIAKRRRATTRNMVANTNSTITRRANIRKAKRKQKATMKDTKVTDDFAFKFKLAESN